MAYIDELALLDNSQLQARLLRAMEAYIALTVGKETDVVPNYDHRQTLAASFVNGPNNYAANILALSVSDGVTNATSTDAQLDARIVQIYNGLAGDLSFAGKIKLALEEAALGIIQNSASTTAQTVIAQKVFRDPDTFVKDARIGIALGLAQQGLDAQSATVAQVLAVVQQLLPAYVATAPV